MKLSLVNRSFRRRWTLTVVVVLVIVAWTAFRPGMPADQLVKSARLSLQQNQYDRAEAFASRVPRTDLFFGDAQLIAGEAASRAGRIEAALRYYSSVPAGSPKAAVAAFSRAELLRDLGRITDAEQLYSSVLQQQPENLATHERMAFLLGATGRRWESLPHLMFLLKSGKSTFEQLALLGDLDRPMDQSAYLKKCVRLSPDDLQVRLGQAAFTALDQPSKARQQLEGIVPDAPNLLAAQLLLGELLVDVDDNAFQAWHSRLPGAADAFPQTWYIRGIWGRRLGELRIAARCFWEALLRDPTYRRSHYQLGQIFASINEPMGQDFALRSRQLFELTQKLDDVLRSKGQDEQSVKRVTELMEQTGRIWEACAWAARASVEFPSAQWAHETATRLIVQLHDDVPRTIPSANLALKHDLSGYPDYERLPSTIPHLPTRKSRQQNPSIAFKEARQCGIDFVYNNGADPATKGARMQEQTGGGVAVLDFDMDGLPDLFLPQGGEWKTGRNVPEPPATFTDRLFRNVSGTSFIDVSARACPADQGFGQGGCAGDFDNDGFVDLYIANIGRNQLMRNNGDGTFTDVTSVAGLTDTRWTTSCVIVDLNADGLPDLIDINYVTGPDVYELICNHRACSPKAFEGVPDQVFVSQGDGTFQLVSGATPQTGSKGLGVIAFDDGFRGRPSLFVANDQVPCFLLKNSPSDGSNGFRLENEGFIRGLSFNQDGLAMAAMGIAADDADGNGQVDFYVTTFKNEARILYLQDANGFFTDAAKSSGLGGLGIPYVGWGTQFLDADLDGWPDLVVANGHVADYRDEGGEFEMRPQFFRNTGAAHFVELSASEAGTFFDRKLHGRGLSRLDWNQDGRMDFVISNINDQATLVTNETSRVGSYLNFRLHATRSARDAIGSVVEVTVGGQRYRKQMVAGDGYMASNERMIQFGLDDASTADRILVLWPSGSSTSLENIPTNGTLELIEGNQRGILRYLDQSRQLRVVISDASS